MISLVPQFFEASVENRVGEQIMDSSVPLFMGEDVETEISAPQESVQNHTLEQVVDCPSEYVGVCGTCACYTTRAGAESYSGAGYGCAIAPHQAGRGVHRESVQLRHHRDDHASSANVGFIKGLDKHNMPRFGDVMVPLLQTIKGFLGHAFKQSVRAAAAAPSSNAELVCFQQSGV